MTADGLPRTRPPRASLFSHSKKTRPKPGKGNKGEGYMPSQFGRARETAGT